MFAAVQRRVSRGLNVIRSFALLPSAEPHVRAVLKSIDAAGLDDLRVKYAGDPDFRNGRKYLRSAWYLRENVVRALTLGLKDSSPLRVLDIGSGAGYFLLACRHFGHEGIGVDLPGKPFYADMFRLLGLHRVEAAVMPKQPLREVAGTFDLITAFAVTFDRLRSGRDAPRWTAAEWDFFLDDMRRLLRPGGRLFLRLNLHDVRGLHDRQEYAVFYRPVPGFSVRVLNRREISFVRTDSARAESVRPDGGMEQGAPKEPAAAFRGGGPSLPMPESAS